MFIDPDLQHTSSLQRSETEARLAYHCRKHCAPLERRLAIVKGIYKHLAPREPEPLFGCGVTRAAQPHKDGTEKAGITFR